MRSRRFHELTLQAVHDQQRARYDPTCLREMLALAGVNEVGEVFLKQCGQTVLDQCGEVLAALTLTLTLVR